MELVSSRDEFQPTQVFFLLFEIEALRKERDVLIEALLSRLTGSREEGDILREHHSIPRSQDPQDHQASHLEFHRDGESHFNGTRLYQGRVQAKIFFFFK
jgi:hypothetical protein